MATVTKTPRLLAAAKEFNIGKDTLVEFLTGKGFEVNASNPNTKISEEMYDALQDEFAQDKAAKRKSDAIDLPRGGGTTHDLKLKDEPKKRRNKERRAEDRDSKSRRTRNRRSTSRGTSKN